MKRGVIIIIVFLTATVISCKKNELKKPSDVSVQMDINRTLSTQGHLQFDSGYIRLANFSVEGTRQEGAPVEMSKSFTGGITINFSNSDFVSELYLDIPQGNYTNLDVEFETSDAGDQPTVSVSGIYKNESNQNIPILFEFGSSESYILDAESDSGTPIIVLDKNIPSIAVIKFDPLYWFDIVSVNQWENATLSDIEGVMTIVVSDSKNGDIYDIVVDRVDDATEVTFGN